MTSVQPYHFSRFREDGFLSFYHRIRACHGFVCFDFEDSIGSDDETLTPALRQQQRHNVLGLLRRLAGQLDFRYLGLRINAAGTTDYAADLAALGQLPELGCVFLPKAEHPAVLQQLLTDLPLPVRQVIPVLETTTAFANLDAILSLADPRVSRVAFGHCDFNLSCGHFPFFHHDSEQYWRWLAVLDRHCQQHGKRLLNSPMLQLNQPQPYQAMLARLHAYPSLIGQITLSLAQAELCAAPLVPGFSPFPGTAAASDAERARGLLRGFEAHRWPAATFAVNAERELLSPHELAAAQQFLQSGAEVE